MLAVFSVADTTAWVHSPSSLQLGRAHGLVGAKHPSLVRQSVGKLWMASPVESGRTWTDVIPGASKAVKQAVDTPALAGQGASTVAEAKASIAAQAAQGGPAVPDASTVDFGALAKATSKIAADANAEGVRSQISKELGGFQNQIPQGVDAQALAKWVSLVPQAIQKQLAGVLASVPAELQPLTVAAIPALALAAVAVSASRAANAPSSPYPREVYDAAAAKAYYDAHPLEYLSRLAYIAGTASTFGATLALDYLTGSLERNAERRADALTDLLTRLGPTYIKVGQALSIRSDLVPPAYLKSLTQLQDKVPAVPTAVAKQIIEAELGRPADEVFSGIEGSPIAAASLGQVYRARLRTDPEQEVAVKVQRPDMIKQVALDMHVLRSNGGLLRLAGYVGDVEGLVDDWGVGFVNELNYQEEARNSAQFMQEIAKTPLADSVFAPEVVLEASGKRVLTTKWIHGERLEKSSADDITGLCSIAMNTYLTMMLETGTMHCDPHPGNLLRTPEGKLCILDWGLVQNIGKDRRYRFIEHIAHLVSRDLDKVPQDLLDLGFIPENQAAVILNEENTAGIAAVYTEIMGGGGAAKIDVTKVLTQLEDLVDKYGQLFQVPPYFAYIARAFSVLEGIGLSNNPDYSIIVECLPYVSQRLLTDDNPRTAGALNTFVFGADKDNKVCAQLPPPPCRPAAARRPAQASRRCGWWTPGASSRSCKGSRPTPVRRRGAGCAGRSRGRRRSRRRWSRCSSCS